MYQEHESPIEELLHLYVDGAFSRRELITRLARHTGSVAAAMTVLGGLNLAHAESVDTCAPDARVPEDAADLSVSDVQFPGDAGTILAHLAFPNKADQPLPGVIVIHENRGLVEHIRDVTRRMARAGFVALGVDLLSRQGGTGQFTDPTAQAQAYGRTTADERLADLKSGFNYLKSLSNVTPDRIGAVGFCAGGGNVWNLAVNLEELAAAVPFYGTPLPTAEQIEKIKSPVLGMYAELDRNLTLGTTAVITTMINQRKTMGFRIYEGAGHAFHNDTGAAYNAAAACDAWNQTIAWFNKFLRKPAAPAGA